MQEYIFYSTDDSFDYHGAFGTQTCYERGLHGFELKFKDDIPLLNTLKGFGEFACEFENITSYNQFKQKILKCLDELDPDDNYATPLEEFNELIGFIDDAEKELKNERLLKKIG